MREHSAGRVDTSRPRVTAVIDVLKPSKAMEIPMIFKFLYSHRHYRQRMMCSSSILHRGPQLPYTNQSVCSEHDRSPWLHGYSISDQSQSSSIRKGPILKSLAEQKANKCHRDRVTEGQEADEPMYMWSMMARRCRSALLSPRLRVCGFSETSDPPCRRHKKMTYSICFSFDS